MDIANTASAFATADKWIVTLRGRRPAELARRYVVLASFILNLFVRKLIENALDFFEFEELLIVHRLYVAMLDSFITSLVYFHRGVCQEDFLGCELNPAQLDDVSFLNGVLYLLVVVLQTSDHEVHVLI